jgi:hypothetical protein
MLTIVITVAVVALTIATLAASEQTDVMATVNRLVEAFNRGDTKGHGKPMKETGSIWTFALQKIEGSWRVTGWAWAKH